jgi:DNA-binding HxlR family transcriptional regulator
MKAKSFKGMACSIAGALEAIGDRWAFLIVRDLSLGLRRYDDLQHSTQIPNTTLSQRLKHLEHNGLIERRSYQDNPPRFEYALTTKGRELGVVIFALAQWGDHWNAAGTAGPPVNFVDRATGRRVKLAVVDAQSGDPVPGSRIEARPGRGADDLVRWRLDRRAAHDDAG